MSGPLHRRREHPLPSLMRWAGGAVVALSCATSPLAASGSPTWEPWRDLLDLADTAPRFRTELRSSYCPGGCRFDRLGPDHPHHLRRRGDERVLFDEEGPGAITRIWMTTGEGSSRPLPADARIRFYFGDAEQADIDLPLPELFGAATPPFVPPLAWSREAASGGNYSVVPVPYDGRLVVTLEAPDDLFLWYQFQYQRAALGTQAEPFHLESAAERLTPLAELLDEPGSDPWPPREEAPSSWSSAQAALLPGDWIELQRTGTGLLTALQIEAARNRRHELHLRFTFDGSTSTIALADLFGAAGGADTREHRSLLATTDGDSATLWIPMPFRSRASIELGLPPGPRRSAPREPLPARLRVRSEFRQIGPSIGTLRAQTTDGSYAEGADLEILGTEGVTRWLGVFANLGATVVSHPYLEGDEHIYVDQSSHPSQHGTGVEDFYGGGFYYDAGPFSHALLGLDEQRLNTGRHPALSRQYRWFLGDAVLARAGVRAGFEAGPVGDLEMTSRHVSFWYEAPLASHLTAMTLVDGFEVGDVEQRETHRWRSTDTVEETELISTYPGPQAKQEPMSVRGLVRGPGRAQFELDAENCRGPLLLRRLFDASRPGQRAQITLTVFDEAGQPVAPATRATLPYNAHNDAHRWSELDLLLPVPGGADPHRSLQVEVLAQPENQAGEFTEYRWELWCTRSFLLFGDGFDSGAPDAWSYSSGEPPVDPGGPRN